MLSYPSIVRARERIVSRIHRTPVLRSSLLNRWLGHEIFFKAECLQKVGAFKARGALNAVLQSVENAPAPITRFVASSSGNHAQAVAWAASIEGIPTTIYMPERVSKIKLEATRSYGAEVVLCAHRREADESAREQADKKGIVWIPPYNHEDVIAGQGTATLESLEELEEVDAVFAPCGGGGLLSGTWLAAKGWSTGISVVGVEPAMADDAFRSRMSGSIQYLQETPETLADGARTLSVGDLTFTYIRKLDDFYTVSEDRIIYWTQWLNHLLKLQIEPTSAMTMEGVVQWLRKQSESKRILVILSGGNMDTRMRQRIWCEDRMEVVPKIPSSGGFES